jgi:NAD(P)-dependent dehydrogenase (short-subunit alcohol dehydrogenase family)
MGALDGKVAIVTGGTSGIGACCAELFVDEGAKVVIAGRRREAGKALAWRLGASASFIETDVTQDPQLRAMIDHAVTKFGRLDCLVNNAGNPGKVSRITQVDLAHFDETIAVHVRGPLVAMKYAGEVMLEQGSGSIINIASVSGLRAGFSALTYSTAKAALIHLTRCAAIDLGQNGIRVNAISPGPVMTGIFGKAAGLDDGESDRRTQTARDILETVLPSFQAWPSPGMVEDIARAAVYLASDASSFVNGHNLVLDGGITAGRPALVMFAERTNLARELSAAVVTQAPDVPGRAATITSA